MDYIELFIIIPIALAAFGLIFKYAAWEEWDDRRRSDRKVHRNLQKMCGR
jgi:hypothetical protein